MPLRTQQCVPGMHSVYPACTVCTRHPMVGIQYPGIMLGIVPGHHAGNSTGVPGGYSTRCTMVGIVPGVPWWVYIPGYTSRVYHPGYISPTPADATEGPAQPLNVRLPR